MSERSPTPFEAGVKFRLRDEAPTARQEARSRPSALESEPSAEVLSQMRPKGRARTLEDLLEDELRAAIVEYVEGVLSDRLESLAPAEETEMRLGSEKLEHVLQEVIDILQELIVEVQEIAAELLVEIVKENTPD